MKTSVVIALLIITSCGNLQEVDRPPGLLDNPLLENTVYRPGPPDYETGKIGGLRVTVINDDPRTFNTMVARDGDSRTVVDTLLDSLAHYDPYKKEFIPNLASFVVNVDEEAQTLEVVYTLRDNLFWTLPDSDERVPLTADDLVFWYDEVAGDQTLRQPGYASQFVDMPDGSQERIRIEKRSRLSVAFIFPRIISNPVLSSNMSSFGPRYLFEPAKKANGPEGMLDILSIDTDVTTIPSIGPYHVVEFSPGQRVVLQRNPHYWKNDDQSQSLPYVEEVVIRIAPDQNTEFLLFRSGDTDSYTPRPEDLEILLQAEEVDYSVFNGGSSLGSSFFTFNQNPNTVDPVKFAWFSSAEFRQAMSSLLNRPRIAKDVYRGLATPAHHFFAVANPQFDPDIRLEFQYDPERAVELLAETGIEKAKNGLLYDRQGNHIEFDVAYGVENDIAAKTVSIFVEDLKQVGITANPKGTDFQSLVQRLVTTFEWDAVTVSLGANYWPSGGSNVWQSEGNFHLWYPLQESPATEWEARIDELYNQGRFTLDAVEAKKIYDEYQKILLTELPLFYTVYPISFLAIRDKWQNIFFDTLGGMDGNYLYLQTISQ